MTSTSAPLLFAAERCHQENTCGSSSHSAHSCVEIASAVDVLSSRNTLGRTGVNAEETILAPARINTSTFGKLWTLYANGQTVAQPLYISKLAFDTRTNPNAACVQ